eukprot:1885360-Rhodomonas_salina.2
MLLPILLRVRYVMSGTDLGYAATRRELHSFTERSLSEYKRMIVKYILFLFFVHGVVMVLDRALYALLLLPDTAAIFAGSEDTVAILNGIILRACYAMPGTDIACPAVSRCAGYAMSGTDLAFCMLQSAYARAMQCPSMT